VVEIYEKCSFVVNETCFKESSTQWNGATKEELADD